MRQTDPRAEVVAVIDADYIVRPQWLRHLVPAFSDPEVAIVQAPQDYRDASQNAFKAMCMAEYRGFFISVWSRAMSAMRLFNMAP